MIVSAIAAIAFGRLAWRQIGPAAAGGRVAAVAGTNRNPNLYYFGAADGGVFKTENGGLTWQRTWPKNAPGALGSLAIAPSDPQTVWAGTGESAVRNDASYGDGVWVTRDGGKRWHNVGLRDSYTISSILVDPRDPLRALAGVLGNPFSDSADRGVYRTTDGGRTWRHTLYAGPQSGVSDMAYDARDPRIVYAGVWQLRRKPWTFSSGGPVDGIYKSADGGVTWRELHGGGLPSGIMGRIGIAVAPSDPRRVYALIQSKAGLLWRSDDAGAHWRLMSKDTLIDQRPFYMSRLAVDPSNENHVFFASENLIETRDGGKSFHDITQAVHQDHHGFWISSDGKRIIEADDGGAPISMDAGTTWDWRYNVVLAQTYHVGYDDENPYRVCGGFQDNDSFCGLSNSHNPLGILEAAWRDVANDSDGVSVWPQPGRPALIWNIGINELNGQLGIYDMRSRQNYDVTPSVFDTNGRPLAGAPYRINWDTPLAFSRAGPLTAYYGANVVFATQDSGRTWRAISPDLTRNDPRKQQVAGGPINTDVSGAEFYDTLLDVAPSPIDANVIWTGSDDGVVAMTADGGAHWRRYELPVPSWGRIECVEPSNASAQRAFAVVDRHYLGDRKPYVLETDDGGATWHDIARGLPQNQFAHVVREDPLNPGVLYAGLEQGIWISTDRGRSWQNFNLNMPSVAVYDLRVQPRTHDLIAGTHGLGLWILDDLTPVASAPAAQSSNGVTMFPIPLTYSWYEWWTSSYGTYDSGCCVAAGEYSGTNPEYGAAVSYYLPRALRAKPSIEIEDANKRVVRRIAATNAAGINRVYWNLTDAPPVRWKSAREWNAGPDDGPAVVPGLYYAVLRAGTQTEREAFSVLPDPRATWTQNDYEQRYTFVKSLDDELSSIDTVLNHLDAIRAHSHGRLAASAAQLYGRFTSGVVNSEDDQWVPDSLRERLTILQGDVALSQGPPLPPHLREAAVIRAQFETAMSAYNGFLSAYTLTREDNP